MTVTYDTLKARPGFIGWVDSDDRAKAFTVLLVAAPMISIVALTFITSAFKNDLGSSPLGEAVAPFFFIFAVAGFGGVWWAGSLGFPTVWAAKALVREGGEWVLYRSGQSLRRAAAGGRMREAGRFPVASDYRLEVRSETAPLRWVVFMLYRGRRLDISDHYANEPDHATGLQFDLLEHLQAHSQPAAVEEKTGAFSL